MKKYFVSKISSKLLLFVLFTSFAAIALIILFISEKAIEMQTSSIDNESENLAAKHSNIISKKFQEAMLTSIGIANFFSSDAVDYIGNKRMVLDEIIKKSTHVYKEAFDIWATFEPNALDGNDRNMKNTPNGSETGRAYCSYHRINGEVLREKVPEAFWVAPVYTTPIKTKELTIIEPYYYPTTSPPGRMLQTSMSCPIIRNGKAIGVAGVVFDLGLIQKEISKIKIFETGYAFLISNSGLVAAHKEEKFILEPVTKLFNSWSDNMLTALKEGNLYKTSEISETTGDKINYIFYPVKILNNNTPWSFVICFSEKEALVKVSSMKWFSVIIGVVSLLCIGIIFFYIIKRITRPIEEMTNIALHISKGNFELNPEDQQTYAKLNQRKDELGNLSRAFLKMQTTLKGTFDKLSAAKGELENYSKNLEFKVEARTAELTEKNRALDEAVENIRTLSQIGQEITSTLNLEAIFRKVYENVNKSLDANSFLIQIINEEKQIVEGKLAIEEGERLPEFSYDLNDKNRFAVWCIDNKQPVFMNDVENEYKKYIPSRSKPKAGKAMASIIYLPLIVGEKVIGVISAQSFNKNAYNENHLDILNNLANYAAIAIDNASAYEKIRKANKELQDAQSQLIQAEKMASLGQLTAGIAHEIKNPLNFINNFSELTVELSKELRDELVSQKEKIDDKTLKYLDEIISDIEHNAEKINSHGKRADSIVKGMLLHSRGKAGEKQKTNINDILSEYLNLAYHGFRAQDSTFNIKMEKDLDNSIEPINVVPQDLSRVFLNIFNNGCYSVHEKKKELKDSFDPVLSVKSKNLGDKVEIRIYDNGKGISQEYLDKIFNPFFTTKPAGKGTGLGLSLSYEIITREHNGELKVSSELGKYAEFTIIIPKN